MAAAGMGAAGCGGASAEEKWAGDVCSAVTTWKSTVQKATGDIRTQLQSPQAGTLAAIDADVGTAVDATKKLSTTEDTRREPTYPPVLRVLRGGELPVRRTGCARQCGC